MKILHTADVHYSRENQIPALKSLNYLYEYGESQGVDLWVIAGDLFDRAVQNTASSGFPLLVEVLQNMMNIAPVVAVKGTPTHDIDGCYKALQEINAEYSFTLIDPGKKYWLDNFGQFRSIGDHDLPEAQLLVLGCPEPSKEWFLRDKQIGKDEANQAVIAGMRQMLLGWGAIRCEYAEIPCLFVYHGQVAGASIQNNQILPAGDIAIGRDDLALVGADYYAIGHIHLAQQLGNLPAYYAGSAVYGNHDPWSETDQKGFNAVEIKSEATQEHGQSVSHKIERVSFPHPRRKKLERAFGSTTFAKEVEGFQTWLDVKANKQQASIINKDSLLTELLDGGALAGSRVTVSVLPTETVRAGHIQDSGRLDDKLNIYGGNCGEPPSAVILEMANKLEAAARAAGIIGEGLHIRTDKLFLRGAIGIYKGLGLDEIEVNFKDMDPGLVALIGDNGEGKTTLIENMHMFPQLLTRRGKLQDHFRLRDSCRDLYVTDVRTGNRYRSYLQIDGKNPSGSIEYHLYKNGEPITNGRKEDYIEKVADLYGSMSLYLRSAFISQKPSKDHPDLSEATKGEKKALFGELGGLDYLQAHADQSKENAKFLEAGIVQDLAKGESLKQLVASGAELEDNLTERVLVESQQTVDLARLQTAGETLSKDEAACRQKVEESNRVDDQCKELRVQIDKLAQEQKVIEDLADQYAFTLKIKPESEKTIAEYERLKDEEEVLNAQRVGILEKRERINAQHRDATAVVADTEKRLAVEEGEIRMEVATKEKTKAGFIAKIDQIQAFLNKLVICPECGFEFAVGAGEYEKNLSTLQKQVWEVDKELAEQGGFLKAVQGIRATVRYPKDPILPSLDVESRLVEIKAEMADLDDLASTRTLLRQAQEAEVRIEEGAKRLGQIETERSSMQTTLDDLEDILNPLAVIEHEKAVGALEDSRQLWRDCKDEVIRLQTEVKNLEKQIEELGERRKELYELELQMDDKKTQIADWRYLERACGPDGIQALELDAMGPGIAEVANRLLAAAYGNRFQIEFRTTRIGGSGSKKKQIEDFQIVVFDSEDGGEQLLETLSGGESVWIKRAIYDAFGIIRDRLTGQRFLTAMQDEADGALDADARVAYFRMLEAAHLESGRHHTIVITHSQDAQEMVSQRIVMRDLRAPVRGE